MAILAELNTQIDALAAELADHFEQHPDSDFYLSLPGVGVSPQPESSRSSAPFFEGPFSVASGGRIVFITVFGAWGFGVAERFFDAIPFVVAEVSPSDHETHRTDSTVHALPDVRRLFHASGGGLRTWCR